MKSCIKPCADVRESTAWRGVWDSVRRFGIPDGDLRWHYVEDNLPSLVHIRMPKRIKVMIADVNIYLSAL